MRRPRVDELDGLRALLALWVVACHIFCWCGFIDAKVPAYLNFFWSEFISGGSAVETFMILSGFAISFLLNGRPQNYLQFLTGRFFRIYPVYLICLMLGLASTYLVPSILQTAQWKSTIYFGFVHSHYVAERSNMGPHLFWHFTLLNGLLPKQVLLDSTGTFLPPAWSITLEWQYYLVAPLLALMVRSGTGILALTLISLIGRHFGGPWVNSQWAFLPAQLPLFLMGIGSYHVYDSFCHSGQPKSRLFALLAATLLAAAILSGYFWVPLVIWTAAIGSVFVRGDDLLSRCLAVVRWMLLLSLLQKLGRMSYCIYLIHWPIILFCLFVFLHLRPALSAESMLLLLFLIGVPVILFASAILHEYIELPAMALGKTLTHRPKAKPDLRS